MQPWYFGAENDYAKVKFKQLTTISNFPTFKSLVQHVRLLCFAKYRKSISLQRDARKCFVTAQGKLPLIESSLQEQVIIRDDLQLQKSGVSEHGKHGLLMRMVYDL